MINGETDICNQCDCIEDHTLVLCCQTQLANEYQEELIDGLATNLSNDKTHPNPVTLALYGAQNITGAVLLDVSGYPEEMILCKLIKEQKMIKRSKKNISKTLAKGATLKNG